MSCNKIQPAVITASLAAGSTASPFQYVVNISQRLCFPSCVSRIPVFAPQFSLVSVTQVGTGLYMATIQAQGVISYEPCNGGCGCTKLQTVSQTFTIPIASTTAPTVTIAAGSTVNNIAASDCQICSRSFVSETPLTVTVATA